MVILSCHSLTSDALLSVMNNSISSLHMSENIQYLSFFWPSPVFSSSHLSPQCLGDGKGGERIEGQQYFICFSGWPVGMSLPHSTQDLCRPVTGITAGWLQIHCQSGMEARSERKCSVSGKQNRTQQVVKINRADFHNSSGSPVQTASVAGQAAHTQVGLPGPS